MKNEDTDLHPMMSPMTNTNNTGGSFIDGGLGLNFYIFNGFLSGTKLAIDGKIPVYYNTNGIQMNTSNIITFGIDTKSDEVIISNIRNGLQSDFQGGLVDGFTDSDNDGIPNKTVSWHLPFDFTLDQALIPEETILFLSFTLDRAVTDFEYWVGGSDDGKIWDDSHIMLEDIYGIYDATDEAYLATFLTRNLKARKVPWNKLWKSFSY